MYKKIIIFISCFVLMFGLLAPSYAFAAGETSIEPPTGVGQLKSNLGIFGDKTGLGAKDDTDLKGKVANVVNVVLGFLAILALIYIIYAGYRWITAAGNEETIGESKKNIKGALIGIMVVLGSYIIVNFAVDRLDRATRSESVGECPQDEACENMSSQHTCTARVALAGCTSATFTPNVDCAGNYVATGGTCVYGP
jgi:hypothetical protein